MVVLPMPIGKVLLLADQNDPHTKAVAYELSRFRAETTVLDVWQSLGELSLQLRPRQRTYQGAWLRLKPRVADAVSEMELFALRERKEFLLGFYGMVEPDGWINDPWRQERARGKVGQLRAAQALGFAVPQTVIGSDISEIELLFEDDSEVIYKPLTWLSDSRGRVLFANTVTLRDIENNREAIKSVPGIFQKRVAKKCEYRVTVIDDEIFPVRIYSQDLPETRVDWRRRQLELKYAECASDAVDAPRLLGLMRELGLRFGAFDLIETPESELVFLEVNPAGNWLWLEERLDLKISRQIASSLLRASGGSTN